MPYKRVGKCVYRKYTGKRIGCSKTIEKAKKYLTTLNIKASEEETFNEYVEQALQQYGAIEETST